MTDIAIQVEQLSKRYRLGIQQERYRSIRDLWSQTASQLWRKPSRPSAEDASSFWALRDLSFTIGQGDRVGIIGRNGAGKSTLLKILSRITEPTQGRVLIQGRVASLLEVGTGFHPELSGRENIFLNGAVLGMGHQEIRRKFDEIVAFAEVERFLDTPVKRYSSGMYVRLAFAVAAHLEPEILVVDEVLAVGDAQFQQKCMGKMQDVAQSGRTVLFVSHNMAAVRQLCGGAILLDGGQLSFMGDAETGVARYLQQSQTRQFFQGKRSAYGVALEAVDLLEAQAGTPTGCPIFDRDYRLRLRFSALEPITQSAIVIRIYDAVGTLVSSICTPEEGIAPFTLTEEMLLDLNLPRLQLMPGAYRGSVFVYRANEGGAYLEAEDALAFEVQPAIVRDAMWAYRPDHGLVRLADGGRLRCLSPGLQPELEVV